jgi:hypothetical protein
MAENFAIKTVQWQLARTVNTRSRVYTFSDIEPDESKENYFRRKKLAFNIDYLKFVIRETIRAVGLKDLYDIVDLIPEELGGPRDFVVKFTAGTLPGSWIMQPCKQQTRPFHVVPTDLDKCAYDTMDPPGCAYIHEILRLVIERLRTEYLGGKNGVPFLDFLIPPHIGCMEWNLRDLKDDGGGENQPHQDTAARNKRVKRE